MKEFLAFTAVVIFSTVGCAESAKQKPTSKKMNATLQVAEAEAILNRLDEARRSGKTIDDLKRFFSKDFLKSRGDTYLRFLLKHKPEGAMVVSSVTMNDGRQFAVACPMKKSEKKCLEHAEVWVLVPSENSGYQIADIYEDSAQR